MCANVLFSGQTDPPKRYEQALGLRERIGGCVTDRVSELAEEQHAPICAIGLAVLVRPVL